MYVVIISIIVDQVQGSYHNYVLMFSDIYIYHDIYPWLLIISSSQGFPEKAANSNPVI